MKKIMLIFCLFLFTATFASAQQELNFPVKYSQDAHYPQGDTALMKYFFKNITYSDEAVKNNITGIGTFSFIVMSDSTIREVVPLSTIGYGIESQIARLIEKLRYAPAVINGNPYAATLIINVRINAADQNAVLY